MSDKGRELLLKDIPEDFKRKYNEYIENINDLGDRNKIIRIAKRKVFRER